MAKVMAKKTTDLKEPNSYKYLLCLELWMESEFNSDKLIARVLLVLDKCDLDP